MWVASTDRVPAASPRSTSLRGALTRRQEARPQWLRPHPRGVRGKAQGADLGDKSRAGGTEVADGERNSTIPLPREQEREEIKESEKSK